jgi:hypothetical protein
MEERFMEQYLQQILDELRAIRRLLEQGGVSARQAVNGGALLISFRYCALQHSI